MTMCSSQSLGMRSSRLKSGSRPSRHLGRSTARSSASSITWSRRPMASPVPRRPPMPRCGPLPHIYDARPKLTDLITARNFPLGLRREALKAMAEQQDGGQRIIDLARDKKLPDDLKTDAITLLITHRDRRIRDGAASVLPVPKLAGGRPLPPVGELIRRNGDSDKGRAVFFRAGLNSCAGCHRVRGQGQWVGPDLSTIGTKYGKDELLRSILNPSAAIGYNYPIPDPRADRRPGRHWLARRGQSPIGWSSRLRMASESPSGQETSRTARPATSR